MQALQLPALFIFQADEKKQAQACFATQPAPNLFKGISQKCISKRYVKAIYSKRYSEFQLSAFSLGLNLILGLFGRSCRPWLRRLLLIKE